MRSSIFLLTALLAGAAPQCATAQVAPPVTIGGIDTSGVGANLLAVLDAEAPAAAARDYTTATFKATRIINGHSIENVARGVLDFRILHRFNTLQNGLSDFFGLDGATTRLGLDYGVTDWLMVGIGRSNFEKEVDGYAKVKLLRQTDDGRMPLSVSYVGAIGVKTLKVTVPEGADYYFSNRLAYTNQVLLARKFSEAFSLQLSPTHVHYNLVPTRAESNDIFALGVGGRLKLSRRFSLNAEWFPVLGNRLNGTANALSLGVDIETGGHVFQLHFTNSTGMTERTFVGQTTGTWADGDIRFGFNISRVFTIVRPKEFRNSRNKIN